MDTPPALTLGESLANVSRSTRWAMAVLVQILFPVGLTSLCAYACISELSRSFFSSVPWRLPALLSWAAYLSVVLLIRSYAELFLPRTPVTVIEKLHNIGVIGVGLGVLDLTVVTILVIQVEDTLVLAGYTCVVSVFIAGLVAFWVWLARTYGASEPAAAAAAKQSPRVPI